MALRGAWSPASILLFLLVYVDVVASASGAGAVAVAEPVPVPSPSPSPSVSQWLLKFKASLLNNTALSSWTQSSPPCAGDHANWVGLLCADGKVWGLQLERMGLKGVIDVESLRGLPDLRTISLMDNHFDSTWPEFHKLLALKTLYLSNNNFSGVIPDQAFQRMLWLKKIHLSNNHFTGPIPTSLSSLPRLMELRLENNMFQGNIPDFNQPTLASFNVANNQLQGGIPPSLNKKPPSSFSGKISCHLILIRIFGMYM